LPTTPCGQTDVRIMVVVLMTDLRSQNQTTQTVAAQSAASDIPNAFAPVIAYREEGNYAMAESWLTEHLLAQSDDAQALAHLAYIQMLRKRDAAAHATLVRAEAIAPDDPLILRNRARLALRAQRIGVAASAIARALAADPADPENRLVQAVVLGVQGEVERALQAVDALLTERPGYAEALANRALLHLRGRNTAAAMADAGAHNNLGTALRNQGKLDEAVACYRQALVLGGAICLARGGIAMWAWRNRSAIGLATSVRTNQSLPRWRMRTCCRRSRSRSRLFHSGTTPAWHDRSSRYFCMTSARKEQNTCPRIAASEE
jgi:tetratricopeptide (TPR) repeat protein